MQVILVARLEKCSILIWKSEVGSETNKDFVEGGSLEGHCHDGEKLHVLNIIDLDFVF